MIYFILHASSVFKNKLLISDAIESTVFELIRDPGLGSFSLDEEFSGSV